jgi:2,3-bisphosphoglycerate-independent phosphoglycerate mutase
MSAAGITEKVVKAIEQDSFNVIVMNYANADMVAHSGKLEPTIKAVEAVDAGLGDIYNALKQCFETCGRKMADNGGPWRIAALPA